MAIVAAFSSGMVAINRASRASTAGTLADKQMEAYRKVRYAAIALASTPSDPLYTGDSAYSSTLKVVGACAGDPVADPNFYYCNPSRKATGPDGRDYRVDSYIAQACVDQTSTPPACATGRVVKLVTVVVRDWASPTTTLFRESSTFDQATG
jgi:type II secretory pathway pseudopilin PulG